MGDKMNTDSVYSATVKSVVPINNDQQAEIEQKLAKIFGRNVTVVNKIDKNLLGGFTIRMGDWFLDASLFNDLQKIKAVVKD